MSVAYFGTAPFGADVLRRLVERGRIEVGIVVSQPDRPSGRGRSLAPPPVAVAARELGLELVQSENASAQPPDADAGIVVAFGQILRAPLLGAYPLVNLHPSRLPRWRGAAPVERAIMAGDAETAVAAIEVAPELDAGPIIAEAPIAIGPEDDAGAVRARALELGVPLLERALLERPAARAQAGEGVTYAHKITGADRVLDWWRPAVELDRQVRASLAAHRVALPRSTAGRSWSGGRGSQTPPRRSARSGRRWLSARATAGWRSLSCSRRGSGGWRRTSISVVCASRRSWRRERAPRRLRGRAPDVRGGRVRRPSVPVGRAGAGRARPAPGDAARVRGRAAGANGRSRDGDAGRPVAGQAPAAAAKRAAGERLRGAVLGRGAGASRGQRGRGARPCGRRRARQRPRERGAPADRGGRTTAGSPGSRRRSATPIRTG